MAEMAEQEPESRGHRATDVVVGDNSCVGIHTGCPHCLFEARSRRQRMPARPLLPCDVIQVDKHGARDMATEVLVATDAAMDIPAEVDHTDVGIRDVLMQPRGVDQRSELHLTTRVSWQKWTSWGRIAWTFLSERDQSRRLACNPLSSDHRR